jgi:succinate dehydrogenase/fumarate reductase-like Fe-S protein
MKSSKGVIDFVEPDDKNKYKSEEFDLKEEDVAELLNTLESVAGQIYDFTFWNEFCGKKNCEWCELRRVMGNPAG